MRILVTNDDGITSPGLVALAAAAVAGGDEVVVVAPATDHSGCGAAIAPASAPGEPGFIAAEFSVAGVVGAWAIQGPPALAVLTCGLGSAPLRPDLVLSGVNRGLNLGLGVLHSGTVGAALTAANLGIPAMAVSVDPGPDPHWSSAASIALATVPWLARTRLPVALNVNVQDRPVGALSGVRAATLGRLSFAADDVTAGPPALDAGSDAALVRLGFATVTVLHGLREAGHETGADAAAFAADRLGQRGRSRAGAGR